jgi:uncharacterized membrane protein
MRIGELKLQARESLKGRKLKAAGATLVFYLIALVVPGVISYILEESMGKVPGSIVGNIIVLIISAALIVGCIRYFFSFSDREKNTELSLLFSGFDSFLKVLGFQILLSIAIFFIFGIIIALGVGIAFASQFNTVVMLILSLLGIVLYVGLIYLGLRLFFVIFIFAEDSQSGIFAAVKRSFFLTKGYVWKLFLTVLSFILWFLSCIFIIPLFYVFPYVQLTYINFYKELKKIKEGNNESVTEF